MDVVIVTHGRLAEGFASAVEVLLGSADTVHPICIDETGGQDVATLVSAALDACAGPVVVVTDVLAGSTTQAAVPVALERGVPLVTGANLGLVMELVMAESFDPTVVEVARPKTVYI